MDFNTKSPLERIADALDELDSTNQKSFLERIADAIENGSSLGGGSGYHVESVDIVDQQTLVAYEEEASA